MSAPIVSPHSRIRHPETFEIGEGSIVDDPTPESGNSCYLRQLDGYMAGAKNYNSRHRKHGLYEYLQFLSADESTVGHRVIAQVEAQHAGLLILDCFLSRSPDFRFHRTTTDCTEDRTVFPDQHLSGLKAGHSSALNPDDRRQRCSPALLAQAHKFIKKIDFHPAQCSNSTGEREVGKGPFIWPRCLPDRFSGITSIPIHTGLT